MKTNGWCSWILAGLVVGASVARSYAEDSDTEQSTASETFYEFEGNRSLVTEFEYTGSHPIVVEAVIEPLDVTRDQSYVADLQFSGFGLMLSNGGYEFRVHDGRKYVKARAATRPREGEKVHLAGVYNGRLVTIFVNGKLEGRAKIKRRIKLAKRPVMIGADPAGRRADVRAGEHFANARIYEVRLLNAAESPGVKRGSIAILRSRINRKAELLYVDLNAKSLMQESE